MHSPYGVNDYLRADLGPGGDFLWGFQKKIKPLAGQHGGVTRTPPRYSNGSISVRFAVLI